MRIMELVVDPIMGIPCIESLPNNGSNYEKLKVSMAMWRSSDVFHWITTMQVLGLYS